MRVPRPGIGLIRVQPNDCCALASSGWVEGVRQAACSMQLVRLMGLRVAWAGAQVGGDYQAPVGPGAVYLCAG
jgi:hypothetical protein